MGGLEAVAGALGGIALGGVGGFLAGDRVIGGRVWLYWLANAAGLVAGVAAAAYGLATGAQWAWVGGVALIGGWATGLKYGHARNPGARSIRERVSKTR